MAEPSASGHHEIVRTFHSTCIVNSYDSTLATLNGLFGFEALECTESPHIGRRGGMTWAGDNSLEIAEPIVPGHATQRFVEDFGAGIHSYAMQVVSLNGTLGHLEAGGVRVGVRPRDYYCFTSPSTTGGLLFEWIDRLGRFDPRGGAELPPMNSGPVIEILNHAFVGALVGDPSDWARRFGPMLGLELAFDHPGSGVGEPQVGLRTPDGVLALYAMPGESSKALWGRVYNRPQFHLLALRVSGLDEAQRRLEEAGVRVLRTAAAAIVIDPRDTGEVPVMLVDKLLEGDPRLPV
jgi:hypothetical protein